MNEKRARRSPSSPPANAEVLGRADRHVLGADGGATPVRRSRRMTVDVVRVQQPIEIRGWVRDYLTIVLAADRGVSDDDSQLERAS